MDTYTCTECGRCQDACPAWLTDKPLSPKKLILDLQEHFLEGAPGMTWRSATSEPLAALATRDVGGAAAATRTRRG